MASLTRTMKLEPVYITEVTQDGAGGYTRFENSGTSSYDIRKGATYGRVVVKYQIPTTWPTGVTVSYARVNSSMPGLIPIPQADCAVYGFSGDPETMTSAEILSASKGTSFGTWSSTGYTSVLNSTGDSAVGGYINAGGSFSLMWAFASEGGITEHCFVSSSLYRNGPILTATLSYDETRDFVQVSGTGGYLESGDSLSSGYCLSQEVGFDDSTRGIMTFDISSVPLDAVIADGELSFTVLDIDNTWEAHMTLVVGSPTFALILSSPEFASEYATATTGSETIWRGSYAAHSVPLLIGDRLSQIQNLVGVETTCNFGIYIETTPLGSGDGYWMADGGDEGMNPTLTLIFAPPEEISPEEPPVISVIQTDGNTITEKVKDEFTTIRVDDGHTATIYQIVERSQTFDSPLFTLNSQNAHLFRTNGNLKRLTRNELQIVLKHNTPYKMRYKRLVNGNWTNWSNTVYFRTRDKDYKFRRSS